MSRKESIPGQPPKRKSSLGLRSWINTGSNAEDRSMDMPSTTRTFIGKTQRNSNLAVPAFSFTASSSRLPRVSTRESRGRRSTSQEPPSARRYLAHTSPQPDAHMPNVGMLMTPVRPTPSRSPGGLSLIGSSNRGSVNRRTSMNILPGTVAKRKDERQISDKIFQNQALSHVQTFLRNMGLQPPTLKPMSNSALIFAFNTIMGEVDSSIKVSNVDYVEKMPMYLGLLQYPAIISKHSFVAVGSGHASNQLIAMLDWLVTTVETIKGIEPDSYLFPQADSDPEEKLSKAGVKVMFEAYCNFIANGTEHTAEDYQDMLCLELGMSRDSEYQLATEIEELQEQLVALQSNPRRKETEDKVAAVDEAEQRVNDLKRDHALLAEELDAKRAKINEKMKEIDHLDTELSRLDDHIAEIQDKVDCQVMKPAERDALREENAKLREEAEHFSNYFEKLQDSVGRIDVDLSKDRKKLGDIINVINCTVLEHGLDEKLKWTMNPIKCDDSEVHDLKKFWEKTHQRFTKDVETLKIGLLTQKKEIVKLQVELGKKQDIIKLKVEEMRNMDADIVSSQITVKSQEESLSAEIDKLKLECVEIQSQLDKLPNMKDVENAIEEILHEKMKLREEHEVYKNLMENEVIPELVNAVDNWQEETKKLL